MHVKFKLQIIASEAKLRPKKIQYLWVTKQTPKIEHR